MQAAVGDINVALHHTRILHKISFDFCPRSTYPWIHAILCVDFTTRERSRPCRGEPWKLPRVHLSHFTLLRLPLRFRKRPCPHLQAASCSPAPSCPLHSEGVSCTILSLGTFYSNRATAESPVLNTFGTGVMSCRITIQPCMAAPSKGMI